MDNPNKLSKVRVSQFYLLVFMSTLMFSIPLPGLAADMTHCPVASEKVKEVQPAVELKHSLAHSVGFVTA